MIAKSANFRMLCRSLAASFSPTPTRSWISLADNSIMAKYPTGGGTANVAISPDGKTAFVVDSYDGKLCVVRIP